MAILFNRPARTGVASITDILAQQRIPGVPQPRRAPGMAGTQAGLAMPIPQPEPQQQADPEGLRLKTWQKVLGAIGDGLQVAGGGRATFAQYVQDMQQQEAEQRARLQEMRKKAEQDALERQMAREDFEYQQRFKAENPGPTALEQNIGYLESKYGPDVAREYALKPTFVQNWDGTRTAVGAGASIQPGHEEDGFIFQGGDPGNPASWVPKGGGAGIGTSGFRR